MKATGNGEISTCVQNLLAIVRGEVPYDRLRGLDPRVIDKPAGEAAAEAIEDAEWMLGVYEPRAVVNDIEAETDDAAGGGFTVTAKIE